MNPISLFRPDDPYERLISSILTLEREPQLRLKSERSEYKRLTGVLSDLDSRLSALHTLLKRFNDPFAHPFDGRAANVPEGAGYGVSASSQAAFGAHTLQVERLASTDTRLTKQHTADGNSLRSFFDTYGAQTFAVGVASPTEADPARRVGVSVTVAPAETTDEGILKEIAAAVNSAMQEAVAAGTIKPGEAAQASVVKETSRTARLSLRSGQTGFASRLTFTDSTNLGGLLETLELNKDAVAAGTGGGQVKAVGTDETNSALNSKFILDGLTLYRSTDQVADALDGVTLGLRQVTAEATTFSIVPAADDIKGEINSFIETYNGLLSLVEGKSKVDGAAGTRGDLAGDSAFIGLRLGLRGEMARSVSGQPKEGPHALTDLGVVINRDGTLTLQDPDRLVAAVQKDADAVHRLFAGPDGLAQRLQTRLDRFVGLNGLIAQRKSSLDGRVARLDTQITAWDERLQRREDMLRAQFARLQESISAFQSQQQYLGGFLFSGGFGF